MKYIVVEPHADDALIGCYHLFKVGLINKVICLDPDEKRQKETQRFCKAMDVDLMLGCVTHEVDERNVCYLVPSLLDKHPEHKKIHYIVKNTQWSSRFQMGYYTTDMNTEYVKELSEEDKRGKKNCLNKFYKSQKDLWKYDWKYWLFEGVVIEC